MKYYLKFVFLYTVSCFVTVATHAQDVPVKNSKEKPISPDLFGIFFEDINYAADGGLYAEMVQNRSFEYNPSDRKGWHSLTAWKYLAEDFAYGTLTVETSEPLNENNPHYTVLNIEDEGQGKGGLGLANSGFDGMVLKEGENYNFSVWSRLFSESAVPLRVELRDKEGKVYGHTTWTAESTDWKKYEARIAVTQSTDSAYLAVVAKGKGKIALDMVSLFPENTFKGRANGLRADLARVIADMRPAFVRFPGGCLVHGDGLENMYRWKNTIGPVEERVPQKNIWGYHQTAGLGYFEYFQFCEDIGAKPLPVLAAAVSCQNSGGTWRIGSIGQKAMPLEDMQDYIRDVLDLIEYANGPVTSTWGAKRAEAGHPQPFNLEYIGIGNEDKITPGFEERFKMIHDAIREKHPEIIVVGTSGPSHSGEDYEKGWEFAKRENVALVDEHYYEKPEWFWNNRERYDKYDRTVPADIYLGEFAAHDTDRKNTLRSALAEAAYMTHLERNGDIVRFSSYAPLFGRVGHTQWNPNLIYFTGDKVLRTVNYYVQQLFSVNRGDIYDPGLVSPSGRGKDKKAFVVSGVKDSETGDIIIKIVNGEEGELGADINLSGLDISKAEAECILLTGNPVAENTFEAPETVVPETRSLRVNETFTYPAPAHSLSVIRIKL
ncbi:alpha-N-arabinofuranosidase [Sinomicrobium pectinilyticum]|uniref:non-reducing end alpha-L-arabinofuranosidase n=1 Tax=Sinomicrobium pectinilyticum TaxID=1084421 RepID=A0A3N0EA50_SINP1|nr:alpha-L-arabinofuranosidase C-terminal domain-containing protein [Sinomicrobium pectinilyticum]RNL84721.1 alpha-N-arabinofuranosidase [Sinomicrobium pectinilyticum]